MKNKLFILLALLSLYSCRNYESKEYITIENGAINDIIRQLINYDDMVKWNDFDTTNTKILLTSTLGTDIMNIDEPGDFDRYFNINRIKDSEMEYYKKLYSEMVKNHKKEREAFAPLTKGKLKERIFDYQFEYSNLQIELIPDCSELKENEYGFLYISRIIFNRCFDKGYLSYEFWCGEDCYWSGNIEIIKVNGKWEMSEEFSGSIA